MEKQTDFIPDGMNAFERNVKRIVDCLLALIAMIIFSPLFLICYIAVKREDGGPSISTSSGACDWTPRNEGPRSTKAGRTHGLPRRASSFGSIISTSYHSYGTCSSATWRSSVPGRNGNFSSTRSSSATLVTDTCTRYVRA